MAQHVFNPTPGPPKTKVCLAFEVGPSKAKRPPKLAQQRALQKHMLSLQSVQHWGLRTNFKQTMGNPKKNRIVLFLIFTL